MLKCIKRIFCKPVVCDHKDYKEMWAFQQQPMRVCDKCGEIELCDTNSNWHIIK